MAWLLLIFLIFAVISVAITSWKAEKFSKNTTLCFTGGLGTGKTYIGVASALKAYRKAVFSWKLNRLLKGRIRVGEKPLLLTNIPIRFKRNEWATQLTREHIILEERIPEHSVVFIDEIGQFASQYDYDNPYVMCNVQEFIRFFRHYIDGRFICTDQASANIVVPIRRRLNIIYNLNNFKRFFGILPFYKVEVSPLEVCEESITNTNTLQTTQDGLISSRKVRKPYFFGYLPYKFQKSKKRYDSRCYSINYKADNADKTLWDNYKTDYFIDITATEEERKNYKKNRKL